MSFTLKDIGSPLKELQGELWEYVPGTKERYCISNMGRLMTKAWRGSSQHRIMKPAKDANGYLRTAIIIDGKSMTVKIHRLVCEAFQVNPLMKPCVNHINFDRADNRVQNLEWVTIQQNAEHSCKAGRIKGFVKGCKQKSPARGEKNPKSILTEQEVLEIRSKFKKRIYTREMLALEYNVRPCTIKDVVLRRSWAHVK